MSCLHALLRFLLVLLVASPGRSWARQHEHEFHDPNESTKGEGWRRAHDSGKIDVKLRREPQEIFSSDGGVLRAWSEDIEAFRNKRVGVAEIELKEDGLLVPQYTDADKIAYVLEGCGRMGAVIPVQGEFRRTYVRRVKKGDVIAIPRGTVYWWYNDGNQPHRVLCAGDSTFGTNPGRFHLFGLAGGKERRFGSLLHGFSRDILAEAWGVDEGTVEKLLEEQNEAGIVKVQRKIRFPEDEYEESELQDNHRFYYGAAGQREPTFYFEELKYSMGEQHHPDFFVKNGGWLKLAGSQKLPTLRHVGFSAMNVFLEANAMCAPSFVRNAHQIVYISRGSGTIYVASGDGEEVFEGDVGQGDVLVIPEFYPSIKSAGNDGLEFITLLTSDRPSVSFLAGANSVYERIPEQVVVAAFNVDEDIIAEVARSRRDEEVIFAPSRHSKRWAIV